ncbi:MAG: LptA/OstA family protein [Acetobacter indonesiensis]|jgi:lipopolysaccharide export system protein LptA|nr:LptA/OstA family protein [Acetobacter indonesiensis]MCI1545428.1 LptA/OstA family protein [Acetobacter indonesiensis]MCI1764835.1 LptA/OstA family protein [Acetobacter indonesiensis]
MRLFSKAPRSRKRMLGSCSGVALLTVLMASGMAMTAQAQSIDLSHGGQITVTAAGGFDWDQNQKKVTAYDQAKAVRGDVTVTADKLIAYYRKKTQPDGSPAPDADGSAPKDAAPPAPAGATTDAKSESAPPAAPPPPAQPNASAPAGGDPDSSGSNEIYRLEAIGHVHIYTQTDQAWGDKAVYDMDQAVLVMNGKAMKLVTPQDLLTARDSMEYYSQQRISIGRGNATVTTNDGRQIRADVLVGYSAPPDNSAQPQKTADASKQSSGDPLANGSGKLEKVNAFGHVWVRTQTEIVTGDRGVYVPDTGIARIVGNVHITRGANQIQGAAAIINMHTGLATMSEHPGSRVSGVVVPNSGDGSDRK